MYQFELNSYTNFKFIYMGISKLNVQSKILRSSIVFLHPLILLDLTHRTISILPMKYKFFNNVYCIKNV